MAVIQSPHFGADFDLEVSLKTDKFFCFYDRRFRESEQSATIQADISRLAVQRQKVLDDLQNREAQHQ